MKRFFAVMILAVGLLPLSVMAENHTGEGGKSAGKRVTADPSEKDFSSRAYSIAGACDTTRPGGPDTGDVGAIPAGGSGGNVDGASGAALFNAKCLGCHASGKPSGATFKKFVANKGQGVPARMQAAFNSLSDQEKAAIQSYLGN